MLGIAPSNPLISLAVAVNILAGITGSASGGMSIALNTLGARYLEMGQSAGIITLLAICKLSHREAYFDIFMVAVLAPILALVGVVALGTLFGSF